MFFLAKWLSHSFIRKILRKRGEGGSLVALQFFDYLKRQLELLIFFTNILFVKNIRNLRINLRNEPLYSYAFIVYMREFTPRRYLALYIKA